MDHQLFSLVFDVAGGVAFVGLVVLGVAFLRLRKDFEEFKKTVPSRRVSKK